MALATGAVALMLVGCGDDSADDDGGSSGSLVSVSDVDEMTVLVDADGHTLYTTTAEAGGQIKCVDECTSFWAPVAGSADDAREVSTQIDVELGVVERPDGESQLTYDGLPLYTFTQEGAGALDGDGFTDDFQGTHFEWSAARTDAQPTTPSPDSADDSGSGFGY